MVRHGDLCRGIKSVEGLRDRSEDPWYLLSLVGILGWKVKLKDRKAGKY